MSQAQILLVDDCKQWRETLRSMLQAIPGYRVVAEAGDGLEAVQKAGQLRPEIVLLDIGMPILNGIDAAIRIRRTSPHSKIVFVTQENDQDVRSAALDTAAEEYLLKSRVSSERISAMDSLVRTPVLPQPSYVRAAITMPAHSLAIEPEEHHS